ncbi:DUF1039 domain-containing protein [Pandoraea oxalativorans]|uniref:Type III secretion protein n=1 Tax=Pandoraea oxalativorans TaxID=573737 RepID=A0A192B1A4_9BURK|nr:DUF1039 domain-containing protein [Pandoraea oxalativorans]ANJ87062.1 hypothetical protein MB84_30955 [Pandoraea oxalativorans]
MTAPSSISHEGAAAWLDASVRQYIVELALVGAQHGLKTQARTILQALPSLVPQVEVRQCLHAALLIALGDTVQARTCLARLTDGGEADAVDASAARVLQHWLDATVSSPASSPPAVSSSPEVLPLP